MTLIATSSLLFAFMLNAFGSIVADQADSRLTTAQLSEKENRIKDSVKLQLIVKQREQAAKMLLDLARIQVQLKKLNEAEETVERSLLLARVLFPPSEKHPPHPLLIDGVELQGDIQTQSGRTRESEKSYWFASKFCDNAGTFAMRGNLLEAEKWFERQLSILTKMKRPQSEDRIVALTNLCKALIEQAKYDEAERRCKQGFAVAGSDRSVPGHRVAKLHEVMGLVYHEQSRHRDAAKQFNQALELWRATYPKRRDAIGAFRITSCRCKIALHLLTTGKYEQSHAILSQALMQLESLFPLNALRPEHRIVASAMVNLGTVSHQMGRIDDALHYRLRALDLYHRLQKESIATKADLAGAFQVVGISYKSIGEFNKARESIEHAVKLWKSAFPIANYPEGHPDLAASLLTLGAVHESLGELENAIAYYRQSLKIYLHFSPKGNQHVILNLLDIGRVSRSRGDLDEASKQLNAAINMAYRLYPQGESPATGLIRIELLGVALARGNVKAARPIAEQTVKLFQLLYPRKLYPRGHPAIVKALYTLGRVNIGLRDYEAAVKVLLIAAELESNLAELRIELTEAESLNFASEHLQSPNELLSIWKHTNRDVSELYAVLWKRRRFSQRLAAFRRAWIASAKNDKGRRILAEIRKVRQRYNALLLPSARDSVSHFGARESQIIKLQQHETRLERDFAATAREAAKLLEPSDTSVERLIDALPSKACFVEIVHYRERSGKRVNGLEISQRMYSAFVLQRGKGVTRVNLGPAKPIEDRVRRWRSQILKDRANADMAREVWEHMWNPISTHFSKETTCVLVSPDGVMATIPWAAMPTDRGDLEIARRFVSLVPSGQFVLDQLRRKSTPAPKPESFVEVSDVDYSAYDGEFARLNASSRGNVHRSISEFVKSLPRRDHVRVVGVQATPSRVSEVLEKARWAHIHTHGFYASQEWFQKQKSAIPGIQQPQRKNSAERLTPLARHPAVRAVLVLCREPGQSGYLTSSSISTLVCPNLELVVSSGCETGLGDFTGWQDMFAQQRAFHVAGARNVIVSLWKVDAEMTDILMAEFYRQLAKKPASPIDALRRAQWIMSQRYHPRYWAGWVVSGCFGDLPTETLAVPVVAKSGPPKGKSIAQERVDDLFPERDSRYWAYGSAAFVLILVMVACRYGLSSRRPRGDG